MFAADRCSVLRQYELVVIQEEVSAGRW